VGQEAHGPEVGGLSEDGLEGRVVAVLAEQGAAADGAVEHVVDVAAGGDAGSAWHGGSLTRPARPCQQKRLPTPFLHPGKGDGHVQRRDTCHGLGGDRPEPVANRLMCRRLPINFSADPADLSTHFGLAASVFAHFIANSTLSMFRVELICERWFEMQYS